MAAQPAPGVAAGIIGQSKDLTEAQRLPQMASDCLSSRTKGMRGTVSPLYADPNIDRSAVDAGPRVNPDTIRRISTRGRIVAVIATTIVETIATNGRRVPVSLSRVDYLPAPHFSNAILADGTTD